MNSIVGVRSNIITAIAFLLLSTSALAADPKVHRDLAYAEPKNERQTFDVYAPKEGKNHPVVFWIHGGGWQRGDTGKSVSRQGKGPPSDQLQTRIA